MEQVDISLVEEKDRFDPETVFVTLFFESPRRCRQRYAEIF